MTGACWQGNPPAPVLHKVARGFYEWRPHDGVVYQVARAEEAGSPWWVILPASAGEVLVRTYDTLRDARLGIGYHFSARWGGPS